MQYALFKRILVKPRQPCNPFRPGVVMLLPQDPSETWRNQPQVEREELQFCGEVKEPKIVAEMVRRDPLARYVLFSGEFIELQVAVTVLKSGIAMESLTEEWSEPKDDEL